MVDCGDFFFVLFLWVFFPLLLLKNWFILSKLLASFHGISSVLSINIKSLYVEIFKLFLYKLCTVCGAVVPPSISSLISHLSVILIKDS